MSRRSSGPAGERWSRLRDRSRPVFSWLPVAGLVPAFLLASWSLTQPWAKGRAFVLIAISRRPEALLLLLFTLLAMVAASVAVAARGKRHGLAASVHFLTAALMAAVAAAAFHLIAEAPTRLLGFVPVATVRAGPGLRTFALASILVAALGAVELLLWTRKRRRNPMVPAPCASGSSADDLPGRVSEGDTAP